MSTVLPGSSPSCIDRHRFEYLWQDNESFKRPTKMPAPEYVEHLMSWVQGNIDNETVFPNRIGKGGSYESIHLGMLMKPRRDIP